MKKVFCIVCGNIKLGGTRGDFGGVKRNKKILVMERLFEEPNPNESECVARMVYPSPKADHKGSALQFLLTN